MGAIKRYKKAKRKLESLYTELITMQESCYYTTFGNSKEYEEDLEKLNEKLSLAEFDLSTRINSLIQTLNYELLTLNKL